jgi:hypothetical protein
MIAGNGDDHVVAAVVAAVVDIVVVARNQKRRYISPNHCFFPVHVPTQVKLHRKKKLSCLSLLKKIIGRISFG